MTELEHEGSFAIMDEDGTLYISTSYRACLADVPFEKLKHIQNTGTYGQLTSEGKWKPDRVDDPDEDEMLKREKKLVTVSISLMFITIFLYWFFTDYLGFLN